MQNPDESIHQPAHEANFLDLVPLGELRYGERLPLGTWQINQSELAQRRKKLRQRNSISNSSDNSTTTNPDLLLDEEWYQSISILNETETPLELIIGNDNKLTVVIPSKNTYFLSFSEISIQVEVCTQESKLISQFKKYNPHSPYIITAKQSIPNKDLYLEINLLE